MTIGPLVLSPERLAMLLGLLAFILVASVLTKRVSTLFNLWSTVVLIGSLAAARLTHVVLNWSFFEDDPLRAFAVWQGGFVWVGALPVIIVASLLLLRTRRLMAWAIVPTVAGVLVANVAFQLVAAGAPIGPPALTLASADGEPIDLAVPSGRITVINLWATWCPPCRREMPVLAAAEVDNPDVRFLFVNQGEAPQVARAYLGGQNLRLKHVLFDQNSALPRHYGAPGIPVTLFLSADGQLFKAHIGEISPEEIDMQIKVIKQKSKFSQMR